MTAARPFARLSALAAAPALEALLYARQLGREFTVEDAAKALGCGRSAARQRLDRLEAAGLLAAEFRRPPGRTGPGAGRPAKVYRVPPEVRVDEFPEHRFPELIRLLLEENRSDPDRDARHRALGRRFARAFMAESQITPAGPRLDRALPKLSAVLGRLGYQARIDAAQADRGTLVVPTCPLRPTVVASAEAVGLDRGFWEGLVEVVSGESLPDLRCTSESCLDCAKDCIITFSREPVAA